MHLGDGDVHLIACVSCLKYSVLRALGTLVFRLAEV